MVDCNVLEDRWARTLALLCWSAQADYFHSMALLLPTNSVIWLVDNVLISAMTVLLAGGIMYQTDARTEAPRLLSYCLAFCWKVLSCLFARIARIRTR